MPLVEDKELAAWRVVRRLYVRSSASFALPTARVTALNYGELTESLCDFDLQSRDAAGVT